MLSDLGLNQDSSNKTSSGNLLLLEIYLHSIEYKVVPSCEDEKYEFIATFKIIDTIHFDLLSSSGLINNRVVKFKNGKSCLFYVPGDYPIEETGLIVEIEVWQKLLDTCLPSKLLIGTCKIQIMNKFIKHFDDDNEYFLAKSIMEQYSCMNSTNQEVLVLNMTLTVTNLGHNLISQYRMLPDKSNMNIHDPRNEIKKEETIPSSSIGKKIPQVNREKYSSWPKRVSPITRSIKGSSSQLRTGIFEKNYFEEIGTVLNGNEIKIRIPKRKNKYSSHTSVHNNNDPNTQNQTVDTTHHKPIQNKILLNMSEDFSKLEEDFSPFSTQVAYANDKDQILTISPNKTPPGVEALKVMHPSKDVFFLQIKKKSKLSADNKVNLELEFITPKGPTKNVTPRLETRETQYDEKDIIKEKNTDVLDKMSGENLTIKKQMSKNKGGKPKKKNKK